jgi:hypothetical protein
MGHANSEKNFGRHSSPTLDIPRRTCRGRPAPIGSSKLNANSWAERRGAARTMSDVPQDDTSPEAQATTAPPRTLKPPSGTRFGIGEPSCQGTRTLRANCRRSSRTRQITENPRSSRAAFRDAPLNAENTPSAQIAQSTLPGQEGPAGIRRRKRTAIATMGCSKRSPAASCERSVAFDFRADWQNAVNGLAQSWASSTRSTEWPMPKALRTGPTS